ncbi:MAG: barstar family protein [Nocardioidaceae bacterium]|nr:barstar family protein [Nocardioidaceae bacterium]
MSDPMNELGAVLAGRREGGVHRWNRAGEVGEVRDLVERDGWAFGRVDAAGIDSSATMLLALGAAIGMPEYSTGANLDAFNDLLRDRTRPMVLWWDSWSVFALAEPERFALVVQILSDRDASEPGLEVLLPGPGPSGAAPPLEA